MQRYTSPALIQGIRLTETPSIDGKKTYTVENTTRNAALTDALLKDEGQNEDKALSLYLTQHCTPIIEQAIEDLNAVRQKEALATHIQNDITRTRTILVNGRTIINIGSNTDEIMSTLSLSETQHIAVSVLGQKSQLAALNFLNSNLSYSTNSVLLFGTPQEINQSSINTFEKIDDNNFKTHRQLTFYTFMNDREECIYQKTDGTILTYSKPRQIHTEKAPDGSLIPYIEGDSGAKIFIKLIATIDVENSVKILPSTPPDERTTNIEVTQKFSFESNIEGFTYTGIDYSDQTLTMHDEALLMQMEKELGIDHEGSAKQARIDEDNQFAADVMRFKTQGTTDEKAREEATKKARERALERDRQELVELEKMEQYLAEYKPAFTAREREAAKENNDHSKNKFIQLFSWLWSFMKAIFPISPITENSQNPANVEPLTKVLLNLGDPGHTIVSNPNAPGIFYALKRTYRGVAKSMRNLYRNVITRNIR